MPAGMNVEAFSKQLAEENDGLTEAEVIRLQKLIVIDVLKRIVEKTPVDKGVARANWQISIGVRKGRSLKRKDVDGSDTIVRGLQTLTGLPPFEIVFIQNNLDYIDVLEDGKFAPANPGPSSDKRRDRHGKILVEHGFSVQSPQGMVSITLVEVQGIYE